MAAASRIVRLDSGVGGPSRGQYEDAGVPGARHTAFVKTVEEFLHVVQDDTVPAFRGRLPLFVRCNPRPTDILFIGHRTVPLALGCVAYQTQHAPLTVATSFVSLTDVHRLCCRPTARPNAAIPSDTEEARAQPSSVALCISAQQVHQ